LRSFGARKPKLDGQAQLAKFTQWW